MAKYKKEDLKGMKDTFISICKWFDTYEDIETALGNIYTKISDPDSERADEFDETYDVMEILSAKTKKIFKRRLANGTLLAADIIYNKVAPKNMIASINNFTRIGSVWVQRNIAFFVDERENEKGE